MMHSKLPNIFFLKSVFRLIRLSTQLGKKSLYLCGLLWAIFMWGCNSKTEAGKQQNKAENNSESITKKQTESIILFFGNSLTAGYGLDPEEAYPALIQNKLDSLGFPYMVINAGVSGETTTTGLKRLEWVLEQQPVDIFVLELGANDGLRGIDPALTRRNLEKMIDMVRKANPDVEIILAGMMVPPTMGPQYSKEFAKIFPEIAEEKDVKLIPFLLENVAGEEALNQRDGIHPTAEGQQILAQNVWKILHEVVSENRNDASPANL